MPFAFCRRPHEPRPAATRVAITGLAVSQLDPQSAVPRNTRLNALHPGRTRLVRWSCVCVLAALLLPDAAQAVQVDLTLPDSYTWKVP